MPRSDWPKAVDARLTTHPKKGAVSTSSESGGEGAGQKECPPHIEESLRKRVVKDEPALKKRRTVNVAPPEPADISFGGSQTAWT